MIIIIVSAFDVVVVVRWINIWHIDAAANDSSIIFNPKNKEGSFRVRLLVKNAQDDLRGLKLLQP